MSRSVAVSPSQVAPEGRDLTLDLTRVACVILVVFVHILFTGVGRAPDGSLLIERTVEGQKWFDAASWILNIMPLFFVVGGYAARAGWRSAQRRGDDAIGFVRLRLARLARPAIPVFVFFAVSLGIVRLLGLDPALVDTVAIGVGSPVWFLAAYALVQALDVDGCDGFHGEPADWTTIQVSGVGDPALSALVGRTIAEIAAGTGEAPVDAMIRILLADDFATGVLMHIGHEENVQAIMRHPVHTGGSDGILVGDRPHPRSWGTFPRYLARYVREQGVLTLEEAVRHLSATPARRLRLADRGLIREGYAADLVLFDPDRIQDRATFAQPRQAAEGIAGVWVAGARALRDGVRTDSLTGTCLRAGGTTAAATAAREEHA